jgi:hypothetical protein
MTGADVRWQQRSLSTHTLASLKVALDDRLLPCRIDPIKRRREAGGTLFFLHRPTNFSCIRSSTFPALEFRHLLHRHARHGLRLPPPHR